MTTSSSSNSAAAATAASAATTTTNNDNSNSIWSREYWTGLMDQQRIERLRQCQALNTILKACEAQHSSKKTSMTTATTSTSSNDHPRKNANNNKNGVVPRLDEYGGGIRMLMYYNWRHKIAANQTGCVPERHSVWTCRAIALGCGQELKHMKTCFDDVGMEQVLAQSKTAYEHQPQPKNNSRRHAGKKSQSTTNSTIPCQEFQQALGKCVLENSQRLAESNTAKGQPQPPQPPQQKPPTTK